MAKQKGDGSIEFVLSFDGSKMMKSINICCQRLQQKFEQSFHNAGQSATKTVESTNEKINQIANDMTRSEKSRMMSIAAIYRKEGMTRGEATAKAWSHIERTGASGAKSVKKSIKSIFTQSKMTASGMEKVFSSSFSSVAKKAAITFATVFSVRELVNFGKSCMDLGSDLQEVQNVVDVTFTSMSEKVDAFAKSAATSAGLSETMTKKYTGTFGAMAKAFGFSELAAYDMSTSLTQLAGDVASFYNLSQDEAYTKLKSVFTGETESLKDLGVVMTQTALDSYALANGFGKTTSQMSEAEKVALRYQFVIKQLSTASGDFLRTSDGWANQVRVLNLQFESLKATLGQGLINVLTPVLKLLNQLIAKLSVAANAFQNFTESVFGKQSSSSASGLSETINAASSLELATESVGSAAKKAAKEMRALMGFDEINKISTTSDDSSSDSSGMSTVPSIDFGNLTSGETVIEQVDSKMQALFENINKAVQPTTESLKRLWNEGLAKLGQFTWTGLTDFYNGFLVPVGKWTFGTGIPRFVDTLNEGLLNVDFQKINNSLANLWEALAPFSIHVGEGLLWFWEEVLVPLGTWTLNEVVPRFLDTLTIAIDGTNAIIEALQPLWQWFWEKVLQPIAEWTGGIFLSVWDSVNGILKKFSDWCGENPKVIETMAIVIGSFFAAFKIVSLVSGIASLITSFGGIIPAVVKIGGLIGSVLNPWTIAIGAIIAVGVLLYKNWDTISAKAVEIWGKITDWFQEKTESIKQFFSNLWQGIEEKFENIGNWFGEKFTAAYNGVKNAFSGAKTFFSDIWSGIKSAFGNITSWFSEKFSAAWQAVKDVFSKGGEVFSGIKDGILSGLKSVINTLITGINDVIQKPFDGLNTALSNLRNVKILGYKPFEWLPSISVPQIPELAKGGFVEKNTPQLAMIGDNRHQGEVVAPEDKLLEMAKMAAQMSGGGNAEILAALQYIIRLLEELLDDPSDTVLYIGDEEIARANKRGSAKLNRRYTTTTVQTGG